MDIASKTCGELVTMRLTGIPIHGNPHPTIQALTHISSCATQTLLRTIHLCSVAKLPLFHTACASDSYTDITFVWITICATQISQVGVTERVTLLRGQHHALDTSL